MFGHKKTDTKKIKKIVDDFLAKIAPEAEVNVLAVDDEAVAIDVKVGDSQALIGQNAETLLAIQHLLRVILKKTIPGTGRVDLDINNYQKVRKEYLKGLAVSSANNAVVFKKEVAMPAMNAYERRVVHMELSARSDIATESRGEEPDRRIVIRPL